MRIERKFKKLTEYTYPHGTEIGLINHLPKGYQEDNLGNYYLEIGERPTTMFTCHLDTACRDKEKVNHVKNGDMIQTDGSTVLGADDKAGMIILLYMIENNIPGLYYFFEGEEIGCIGSTALANQWFNKDFSDYITKIISFDRRGTDSIITEQGMGVCCSNDFANSLSNQLNNTDIGFDFQPDPTGIFTDSAEFMELIPECTNVSVGYYNEHTTHESQDIKFLKKMCEAVCLVDWESLPIIRDPQDPYYDYMDDYQITDQRNIFFDDWSKEFYSYFNEDGITTKLYISITRIEEEKKLILNWFKGSSSYSDIEEIIWDGNDLQIDCGYGPQDIGNRVDLSHIIPELEDVPIEETLNEIEFDEMIKHDDLSNLNTNKLPY